jgi:hypothetical protein
MTSLERRGMEVADDYRRAAIGHPGELKIRVPYLRQVTEHKPAPNDIERSRLERHVPNVADYQLDASQRTVCRNSGREHLATSLESHCNGSPRMTQTPSRSAACV